MDLHPFDTTNRKLKIENRAMDEICLKPGVHIELGGGCCPTAHLVTPGLHPFDATKTQLEPHTGMQEFYSDTTY